MHSGAIGSSLGSAPNVGLHPAVETRSTYLTCPAMQSITQYGDAQPYHLLLMHMKQQLEQRKAAQVPTLSCNEAWDIWQPLAM